MRQMMDSIKICKIFLEPSPEIVEAEVTLEEEEEEASTASEEIEEEKPIEGKEVEVAIEEG